MIKSFLIKNQTLSDASRYDLCKFTGRPLGLIRINFMVFKIEFKRKTFYACLSGGKVFDGEPRFTSMGQWALEALGRLNIGDRGNLYMREMRLGPTSLKRKTFDFLETLPSEANICFFGDMSGALDGRMFPLFNIQSKQVEVG